MGAPRPVQVVLLQSHDDASGHLGYDDELDDVVLSWPRFAAGVASDDAVAALEAVARELSDGPTALSGATGTPRTRGSFTLEWSREQITEAYFGLRRGRAGA